MTKQESVPPEPRLRRYRKGDAAAVRALHDRTPPAGSPPSPTPQPWPPDLADIPHHFIAFWVAEIDDEIVGMAGLVAVGENVPAPVLSGIATRGKAIRLTRMRIAPEWQRRGIGSRLVDAVLAWVRDRGYTHVVLETTAGQAAAIALYRRHGFEEITRSTLGPWVLVWMRRPVG
jgi:GNAT superfamily N-acetyltransferase